MSKAFLPFLALSLVAAPVFAQVERASAPVSEESSKIGAAPGVTVLLGAIAVAIGVVLVVDDDDDEPVSG